jgi:hypothetical protein
MTRICSGAAGRAWWHEASEAVAQCRRGASRRSAEHVRAGDPDSWLRYGCLKPHTVLPAVLVTAAVIKKPPLG